MLLVTAQGWCNIRTDPEDAGDRAERCSIQTDPEDAAGDRAEWCSSPSGELLAASSKVKQLLHGETVPFLGTYPREVKTWVYARLTDERSLQLYSE